VDNEAVRNDPPFLICAEHLNLRQGSSYLQYTQATAIAGSRRAALLGHFHELSRNECELLKRDD
jgi:hypothetical protein